ncbi:uncharacterized protein [Palaemon carinicauda]
MLQPFMGARLHKNGQILLSHMYIITLSCPMFFQDFPFDTQTCYLEIASYFYGIRDVTFGWHLYGIATSKDIPSLLGDYEFEFEVQNTTVCMVPEYVNGNYPCLKAFMRFKRRFKNYLIGVYVPSLLFVTVAWASFFWPPDAVPARTVLLITCLLTMISLYSGIQAVTPPANYTRAIDIWFFACILAVAMALFQYAVILQTDHKPTMSTDPAAFVAGVPVKISERFRPPRRITLPASCQHQINPDLLTQEYDFAIEKTTLSWVHERRLRLEKEEKDRKARIEAYEKIKLEKKAKEEEERLRLEEEERQRVLKEEEEEKKRAEEEENRLKEELDKEEVQPSDHSADEEGEDPDDTNKKTTESEGSDNSTETQVASKDNHEVNIKSEAKLHNNNALHSSEVTQPTGSPYLGNTSLYNKNTHFNTDMKTPYPDMLKPTPFPSQKDSIRTPLKMPTDINFADFEGDANDPFEGAALKSINDLEELAKVLDSSNINSQPKEGSFLAKSNSSEEKGSVHNMYPNGQTSYGTYSQYPYYMQQHQQQSYGQFTNQIAKNSQVTSASPTVPSYTSNPQYSVGLNRTYQNSYYNQQWNNSFNVSSPSKPSQFGTYDYHLQSSNVGGMSPGSANVNLTTATATIPVASVSSLQPGSVESGNPAKRQDLEDFYSKYYSHNKATVPTNQQSVMRSGDSTPSHGSGGSGAAGSTNGSLRSCRSVPDLTAAADSEVTIYSNGIQSQNESRSFTHTLPPRPSSTGLSGLEDWKPLPDLSSSPELSPSQQNPPHGPPSQTSCSQYTPVKSRLPDPFAELTADAQVLVQSMAEMGFPRPRVARAVQKLGTDHKKLIEVLLVLQSLQDTGEDEYKAELAFYYYMGDIQKTKDHLSAAKQLLALGFEEAKVIDALLKHNNDRDKALEELIA